MKSSEANIFLFIAALIIGILLSMNISISKGNVLKNQESIFEYSPISGCL